MAAASEDHVGQAVGKLPTEIWARCLSYLETPELLRLSVVCRLFRAEGVHVLADRTILDLTWCSGPNLKMAAHFFAVQLPQLAHCLPQFESFLLYGADSSTALRMLVTCYAQRMRSFALDDKSLVDADLTAALHNVPLPRLQSLTLRSCHKLSDDALAVIANIPSLQRVHLIACTKITDDGVSRVARRCRNIEDFSLEQSFRVSNAALGPLAELPYLHSLCIDRCLKIDDTGLARLAPLRRLRTLDLSSCPRISSLGITRLLGRAAMGLERLLLGGCGGIDDQAVVAIAQSCRSTLQELNLSGCAAITAAGLSRILECQHLRSLNVTRIAAVGDDFVHSLVIACPRLEELTCFGCPRGI